VDQQFEGHEQTDVAIRPLVWTLVAIALVIVVSGIGLWGLFEVFKRVANTQAENKRYSNVEADAREVPAGYPPLQGIPALSTNQRSPAQDMEAMKRDNEKILAGNMPMRPGLPNGKPIEAAMDEALSKKIFKTQPAAAKQPQQPVKSR
jgi:hypothetical protein